MADDTTLSDTEHKVLLDEIRMAEARNEQELEPQMREALERYTGVHIPDIATAWSIIVNEIYPVVQYNLPSTFFRNPRIFLKPRNKTFVAKRRDPITQRMEEVILDAQKSATTQEAITNYTLTEIRYKQETRRVLLDALLFKMAVLWHGYKGKFGLTQEGSLYILNENVFVKRLCPLRFLFDPSVNLNEVDEARWTGRSVDLPLLDVLEDETMDVDKRALKGRAGYGEQVGTKRLKDLMKVHGADYLRHASTALQPLLNSASKDFKDLPQAKFVRVYEIFKRPTPKEAREGKKGKLLLLTFEQQKPLKVNKWPYKAEGWPGKLLFFNDVPDQPFPMADVSTYGTIADHKNLVINQQIRNAEETNKLWVALNKTNGDEEDVEKVLKGENTVVTFEGDEDVRSKMAVFNASGMASPELYQLDQRIERNLQDKSGVTDLKRGFLQSGEESAESVKQRAAGGSARPMFRQDIMAEFLKESVGYINDLLKQYTPVKKAVRIVGSLDLEWSNDFTEEEIQADVDVELDVVSMLPENPQEELRTLGATLEMAVNAINNPAVTAKLQQEGKTLNLSPLIEQILLRQKLRDPEIFRSIKPEESMGFVSVAELRAAQANTDAALTGQPMPSPPEAGQDHRARLEVYSSVAKLLKEVGQVSDLLEQLIMLQTQVMQDEDAKENPQAGQSVSSNGTFGKRSALATV